MRVASLQRSELVDWLGGQPELPKERLNAKFLKSTVKGRVLAVWNDDHRDGALPILAVRQSEMRDFFAFVSTYISAYKPFSAYFTVVPVEYFELLTSSSSMGAVSKETFSKLVAVAFAEAYVQAGGKVRSLDDLTVQGVQATLSSALMSAIWKGFNPDELDIISERWLEARRLMSDGPLSLSPSIVLEVWKEIGFSLRMKPIAKQRGSSEKVSGHLRDFFAGNTSFEEWFLPIAQEALGNEDSVVTLKGAREERVKALPDILSSFRYSNAERPMLEFVAGGLLSMVGNGSMSQLRLAMQLAQDLPKSNLWFGVMSSLQSRTDVLTASSCLGRRVLRELLRDVGPFSPPMYDISLDEIAVLGDKTMLNETVRTGQSGTVNVGLLGSVSAPFRRATDKRDSREADLRHEAGRLEADRLEELRFLLDHANRLLRDLFERETSRTKKPSPDYSRRI